MIRKALKNLIFIFIQIWWNKIFNLEFHKNKVAAATVGLKRFSDQLEDRTARINKVIARLENKRNEIQDEAVAASIYAYKLAKASLNLDHVAYEDVAPYSFNPDKQQPEPAPGATMVDSTYNPGLSSM